MEINRFNRKNTRGGERPGNRVGTVGNDGGLSDERTDVIGKFEGEVLKVPG